MSVFRLHRIHDNFFEMSIFFKSDLPKNTIERICYAIMITASQIKNDFECDNNFVFRILEKHCNCEIISCVYDLFNDIYFEEIDLYDVWERGVQKGNKALKITELLERYSDLESSIKHIINASSGRWDAIAHIVKDKSTGSLVAKTNGIIVFLSNDNTAMIENLYFRGEIFWISKSKFSKSIYDLHFRIDSSATKKEYIEWNRSFTDFAPYNERSYFKIEDEEV